VEKRHWRQLSDGEKGRARSIVCAGLEMTPIEARSHVVVALEYGVGMPEDSKQADRVFEDAVGS